MQVSNCKLLKKVRKVHGRMERRLSALNPTFVMLVTVVSVHLPARQITRIGQFLH